jgi:hypothetical protein
MNFATKTSQTQRFIWVIWLIVLLVAWLAPATGAEDGVPASLLGVTTQRETDGVLYPWQRVPQRWKKWALRRYRAWQKKYRQAQGSAQLARLALKGLVPLAWRVERLTRGSPVPSRFHGLSHNLRPWLGSFQSLYSVFKVRNIGVEKMMALVR